MNERFADRTAASYVGITEAIHTAFDLEVQRRILGIQ